MSLLVLPTKKKIQACWKFQKGKFDKNKPFLGNSQISRKRLRRNVGEPTVVGEGALTMIDVIYMKLGHNKRGIIAFINNRYNGRLKQNLAKGGGTTKWQFTRENGTVYWICKSSQWVICLLAGNKRFRMTLFYLNLKQSFGLLI